MVVAAWYVSRRTSGTLEEAVASLKRWNRGLYCRRSTAALESLISSRPRPIATVLELMMLLWS